MPLIQLHPHPFTILPSHPSLPPGPPRPEAKHVASTALQEALELLNSDLPTWEKDPKPRRSPPAYADIRLSRKWRKYEQMPDPSSSSSSPSPSTGNLKRKPEFWVCRQSEHPDAAVAGSAPWTEFEDGLRSEHAEHEMEYTPSVTGVERLLQWTEQEIGELDMNGVTFKDVDVEGECPTMTPSKPYILGARGCLQQVLRLIKSNSQPNNSHLPPNSPNIPPLLHLIHNIRHIRRTQQRTLLPI